MAKTIRRIIIIALVVAAIFGIGFYKYKSNQTIFNEDGVNGNTIGNLYGNGLFCEIDGIVYFANPNDDNALYSMSPDESNVTKICDDRVYFINADNNYLYYSRDHNNDESSMSFLNVNTEALCRIDRDGKNVKILDDAVCNAVSLSGNTLYYYHYDTDTATTLYSVKIDGSEKGQVVNESIDPRCMVGSKLYYSGVTSDHNIHVIDVDSGAKSLASALWLYMPTVSGDDLYVMDLDDNNRIVKISLSDGSRIVVSSYGTSDYNLAGNYIYYQSIKGEPDGLYRIDLNTLEETLIKEGEFNSINVTSQYIYYTDFFSEAVYHTKIGLTGGTVFSPAIELED